MPILTKSAYEIFAPIDSGGNPRGPNNSDVQTWGIEIENSVVANVGSKSDLEGSTINAATKAIKILGYTSAGDGGQSFYKRVDAEPTHEGKIRSTDRFLSDGTENTANGGWWELSAPFIHAKMFGVVGDGSADDTTAFINAGAFAKAVGGLNGKKVWTGAGRFKITTLTVPDGVVFEGEGERTSRFEKSDADAFSWMAESEGFDADLAANDFSYSGASSLNTGFRNCGFYGLKTYPSEDATVSVVNNAIWAANGDRFRIIVNGGGTITDITGRTKGHAIKLVRGDTDLRVNLAGTDNIDETLTDGSPYIFLTYTGTEWRLTSEVGKIAGGVRLYTRRPIMDNVQVFNVLGRGIWLAGPDDGGSTNANEMPEGYVGPLYVYRASSEGCVVSGFHDAVIKSLNVGSNYYTGLLCERDDDTSNCTGEILHCHIYGGKYRGIEVRGPMHFGECISESNDYEGLKVAYLDNSATGPCWFTTLQVYSNCSDAGIGVNASRQAWLAQSNCVVGKFLASAAGSTDQDIFAISVTANRVQVHGINIVGNSNTYGIRNSGNYNQFSGVINNCSRGVSIAGGAYCQYNLQMQSCTTQVHNLGGDFTHSLFDISFFTSSGSTWGGTAPTVSQRLDTDFNIRGKIGTTNVRSRFTGSHTFDLSSGPGEQKTTLTHGLWYTPDISEVSFGLNWAGANFGFTSDGTDAFLGPYTDDITSTTITLAIYHPSTQSSNIDASIKVN